MSVLTPSVFYRTEKYKNLHQSSLRLTFFSCILKLKTAFLMLNEKSVEQKKNISHLPPSIWCELNRCGENIFIIWGMPEHNNPLPSRFFEWKMYKSEIWCTRCRKLISTPEWNLHILHSPEHIFHLWHHPRSPRNAKSQLHLGCRCCYLTI